MKLGVDFGSTYSAISRYDELTDNVEALVLNENGSPYIPSVAALDNKGKMLYGKGAKNKVGKKNFRYFEAFKMLLPETDVNLLKSRGFSDYTPREITKGFLDSQLKSALKKCGAEEIEKLVVCVPEVWNEKVDTLDGRTVLRDLCRDFSYVKNVQIVSEPAAASAFFAYNYQKANGEPYTGKILLIDYGGGTLDITLTEVLAWRTDSGKKSVEIKILDRTGAGENQDGRVGNAGIAYMEGVVGKALIDACLIDEGGVTEAQSEFLSAVNQLEQDIIERCEDIEEYFDMYGINLSKIKKDDTDEEFTTIEYEGEEVPVYYSQLLECYNNIIFPVLEGELQKIISFMETKNIQYNNPNQRDFRIEVVGGFGNFYLVKKQIDKLFSFTDMDKRRNMQSMKFSERAIALGAGLLAAGVIAIKNTASYSIGVFCKGTVDNEYAITYRQDLEYDKIYWHENVSGQKNIYLVMPGMLDSMLIGTSDAKTAFRVPLRENFKERIQNAMGSKMKTVAIGFSFDQSGIVSLHVCDYNMKEDLVLEHSMVKIELSSFSEMFEMGTLESVVIRK